MKKVIILHGTMGSPAGNWFGWLQVELKAKGLQVWLPELPNPEQPSLKQWAEFVATNCPFDLDQETLIVGHSSGAILALVLTQKSAVELGGIVCVSVFHDNSLNWDANSKLFDVEFDYQAIKKHAKTRLVIHSDDDPYVPVEQAKFVAQQIDAEFLLIPNQGHFNLEKSADYKQFPKLIEMLQDRRLIDG